MPEIGLILRRYARTTRVRLDIIEKDYALSYLLAAIAATPAFGKRIALKGGTALKKIYYPDYRFSEDLDYSTLPATPLEKAADLMEAAIGRMRHNLQERGDFDVSHEPLVLKQPHPGGQIAFLVRVRFPEQRQALCRLKVEITIDEPVLLPPVIRPLLHNFSETLDASIQVYALPEIVAEKLRTLLQSRQRLAARGWGASRVCRDYYDLWEISGREQLSPSETRELLQRKCALREVSFTSWRDFLAPELLDVARSEWQQQLLPFVPNAPSVERVLNDLSYRLPALLSPSPSP